MTRDTFNLPSTRTWRDIPQPVVPRAMSREGRWRLVMAALRCIAVGAVAVVCGWGVWLVAASISENAHEMPAAAKGAPMKRLELRTDGVLDDKWLVRTLALPRDASLMELDLERLRARLLADDQVVNATLTRSFPDRLIVQLSERGPVARVMTAWLGQRKALLVSRDGVIYAGNGYDPAVLATLPWLDGVSISSVGGKFRPIAGMEAAAELLAKARLEAEHLYATWNVISLAKLASDGQLEVRTKGDTYVATFTTRDDFFRQLVKLNYICDQLAALPAGSRATIDLTLGATNWPTGGLARVTDVPVTVIPPAGEAHGGTLAGRSPRGVLPPARGMNPAGPVEARSDAALFVLPHPQPRKTTREF